MFRIPNQNKLIWSIFLYTKYLESEFLMTTLWHGNKSRIFLVVQKLEEKRKSVILSNHLARVMGQRQKRCEKTKPLKWEIIRVRCQILVPFQTSSTVFVSQILLYSLLHYLAVRQPWNLCHPWPGVWGVVASNIQQCCRSCYGFVSPLSIISSLCEYVFYHDR